MLSCACSLAGAACGSSSGDFGDTPLASGAQLRWEFSTSARAPETLLVLVDDTEAAVALRAALGDAFDDWDAALARHGDGCGGPFDPAAWHPLDRSVVFVHPSSPAAMGYWSPAQDPALRLHTQQTLGVEHERWLDAVRAGINAQPAPPGAAFQALAALSNAESLLNGARAPETAAESELLQALPNPAAFVEVIALATEDASPGEPSGYPRQMQHELLGAVLPAEQAREPADCAERRVPTTPRYQAYGEISQAWPCADPDFFATSLVADCVPRCLRQPIAVDAGMAQCRAMASYPGREPCPTELGWLDPLAASGQRAPLVTGSGAGAMRVCEIRQLEGTALAACVTRLDCAECEPGWCATEVPELLPQRACEGNGYYPPFRFVLGAAQARSALVTIVCNQAAR